MPSFLGDPGSILHGECHAWMCLLRELVQPEPSCGRWQ